MTKIERPVVLGTGQLGMAIMDELVGLDLPVVMVNRSGRVAEALSDGVTVRAADLYDSTVVRAVCEDADVVFLCAQPDYTAWPEQFPPLIDAVLAGLKDQRATLVFGDNLYMYGPTGGQPLREDLPYAATGRKGRTRADIATRLLAAHEPDRLEVVLGRGSDFYGPRVTDSSAGETLFGAAIADKPVNLIGDIDQPHTYTYIRDFARALIVLAEVDSAHGQAWHVPNAPTVSSRAFVEEIAAQLGQPLKIRTAGRGMLTLLGLFNPMLREMKEMYYEFSEPFIVDDSKYRAAFSDEVTPRDEAIRATLDWYRQQAQNR